MMSIVTFANCRGGAKQFQQENRNSKCRSVNAIGWANLHIIFTGKHHLPA